MVSCILLAAGESKRFGSPKQLAKINKSQTIIEYIISNLLKTGIDEIIVVLGAFKEQIKPLILKDIKVCVNENYQKGQTSSLKIGAKNISKNSDCFMVLPVDMPLVKPETFDYLIDKFKEAKKLIVIPSYKYKKGHPPIYDIKLKDGILKMGDDEPLYSLNNKYVEQSIIIPVDDSAVITNINTPQDLAKIKA